MPAEAPRAPTEPSRVIRPETAATLRRLMEGVVLNGTGKLAHLDGWTAAGKNRLRAENRSGDGPIFADAADCFLHRFCPNQRPGGDDSSIAGFAGRGNTREGRLPRRFSSRIAEQVLAASGRAARCPDWPVARKGQRTRLARFQTALRSTISHRQISRDNPTNPPMGSHRTQSHRGEERDAPPATVSGG